MLNISLSPWPSFTQEEADAVSKVLLSNKVNYWTGMECREFEKEFAAFVGTQYAVALSNGTLALDVAFKAMGIGQGDDVIVTSRTFLASASCIVTAGANPVFADVDLNSQNISAETIKAALTPNTKAIIVVHLAGMPAEMDDIMALAKEHNLWVIEDCAQAHGAKYKGKSVGSIGHVGCLVVLPRQIMTTGGEGGMVTTNDKELWSKNVVVQRPRQKLRCRVPPRTRTRFPLVARKLRHQLAHDGNAGCHRPHPAQTHARMDCPPSSARR